MQAHGWRSSPVAWSRPGTPVDFPRTPPEVSCADPAAAELELRAPFAERCSPLAAFAYSESRPVTIGRSPLCGRHSASSREPSHPLGVFRIPLTLPPFPHLGLARRSGPDHLAGGRRTRRPAMREVDRAHCMGPRPPLRCRAVFRRLFSRPPTIDPFYGTPWATSGASGERQRPRAVVRAPDSPKVMMPHTSQ